MMTRRLLLQSAFASVFLPLIPPSLLEAHAQELIPRGKAWLDQIAQQLKEEFNLPAVWIAANVEDKIEAAAVGVRKVGNPTLATIDDLLTPQ